MIAVLWTILSVLKIIGIILLILLALVILLICLVLFAPVSFRVRLTNEEAFSADGSVSWLGPVLRAVFRYDEGDADFAVKVCGLQIIPKKEKKKAQPTEKKPQPEKKTEQERRPTPETETPELQPAESGPAETALQAPETHEPSKQPQSGQPKKQKQPKQKKPKKAKQPKRPGKSGTGGFSDLLHKVRDILGDDDFSYAVARVFSILGGFLGSIRFRTLSGDASFSLGSPDRTGMATGVMSTIPVFYGKTLSITPDFESEEISFRGTLSGGGSLKLIHLVIAVVKLMSDKKLKKMMHLIRN